MSHRPARMAALIGPLIIAALAAEAASPVIENLLPRGAQRGTSIEVRFTGHRLEDAIDLLFHQPGIALQRIVEAKPDSLVCELVIESGCALGRHAVRVRTQSGLSNPFVFSVGALPEAVEQEPNSTVEEAQVVPLEVTVNGVVTSEDVDFFAVDLKAGERLAVEIEGIRLGHTLFDPKLRLFGPGGHELISEDDTPAMRQDAAFVHTVPETGRYCVAVSEASYGGSSSAEYRLHIGTFPRPLAITPVGGPIGEPIAVQWLGDLLDQTTEAVPVSFTSGPAQIELASPDGYAPTPLPFHASSLPATMESEPNDAIENAAPITVPGAFEGVVGAPGDVDWFAFDGSKDQSLDVNVVARAVGSPLDSVVRVTGPDGGEVFQSDDSDTLDSGGRITLPADGRYAVSVRDHLGHGGETFVYRVEVAPPAPALWLTPVDNEACAVTVPAANHAFALLSVNRRGFDDTVNVTFDGLPQGVAAAFDPIPAGATQLPVVFSADPSSAPAQSLVNVQAASPNGVNGTLSHTIRLVLGVNDTVFDSLHTDRLAMAVANPAPFTLELVPPRSSIPKNGGCTVTVRATRQEGFTAPIAINAPWTPPGIGLPSATIAEAESETQLRLEVYDGAVAGRANLVLTGESAGYVVSTPFTPVTIDETWMTLDIQELQVEQGSEASWPAQLTVNHEFDDPIVIGANGVPKGVTAEPLEVDPGNLAFQLAIAPDAPEGKQGPIAFDTTVTVNGEPVHLRLGSAPLKIFKPLPPKLAMPEPAPKPEEPKEAPARRTRFPTEM